MKQSQFCLLCLTIAGAPHLNDDIATVVVIIWAIGALVSMYLERND